MPFFKKSRPGGSCSGDKKTGGGIKGMLGQLTGVKWMIPGAGEMKGYDQVVTKRSGANKK